MKVRVTLMTENDKHMPVSSKEEAERICRQGWDYLCKLILSGHEGEKATVESIEVIEN